MEKGGTSIAHPGQIVLFFKEGEAPSNNSIKTSGENNSIRTSVEKSRDDFDPSNVPNEDENTNPVKK